MCCCLIPLLFIIQYQWLRLKFFSSQILHWNKSYCPHGPTKALWTTEHCLDCHGRPSRESSGIWSPSGKKGNGEGAREGEASAQCTLYSLKVKVVSLSHRIHFVWGTSSRWRPPSACFCNQQRRVLNVHKENSSDLRQWSENPDT